MEAMAQEMCDYMVRERKRHQEPTLEAFVQVSHASVPKPLRYPCVAPIFLYCPCVIPALLDEAFMFSPWCHLFHPAMPHPALSMHYLYHPVASDSYCPCAWQTCFCAVTPSDYAGQGAISAQRGATNKGISSRELCMA